jgi:hypothetical protein
MAKVKIGLSNISPADLLLKASHIRQEMTGNTNFATPSPTMLEIEDASDALGSAIEEAMNRDSSKIALRNIKYDELKYLLEQLGSYVQNVSLGDAEIIISSGFEVLQQSGPIGPLPAAAYLTAKPAGIGSEKLNWDAVRGARVYIVEQCTADPAVETAWTLFAYTTQSRYTATDLTTGQLMWFRVKAIGAAGVGVASDPARCVVS